MVAGHKNENRTHNWHAGGVLFGVIIGTTIGMINEAKIEHHRNDGWRGNWPHNLEL